MNNDSNAIFDGYAQKYDQWFIANPNLFLSELKLVKSALDLTNTERTLSVGCGSGLFEEALHRKYQFPLFDGVEPSVDMANIAKKRGLNVIVGTAETVSLPTEKYNTIYFNGSSSYIKDLTTAYQNCLSALKSGGHFILMDIPKESAYGLIYMLADQLGTYDCEQLSNVTPQWPYPIELVGAANWRTTKQKQFILEQTLNLKNIQFQQTLVANPLYTNEVIENPAPGFTKGSYVAIIAEK